VSAKNRYCSGVAQLVERRARMERLRNVCWTPNAVARRCALGITLNAVSHLGTKQSTRAQPNEGQANRTASVLEWYDRHRTYSCINANEKDR